MAEWFEKLKTMIMGEPDEYEAEYDDYDEDEEEPIERKPSRAGFTSTFRNAVGGGSSSTSRASSANRYPSYSGDNTKKVYSINTNIDMEVVVATPTTLEEAARYIYDLRDKTTVVANLESLDTETAQRITDFLCGACHALDGIIQPVSNRIFVIVPSGVRLSGNFKEELEANGIKFPNSVMWK